MLNLTLMNCSVGKSDFHSILKMVFWQRFILLRLPFIKKLAFLFNK